MKISTPLAICTAILSITCHSLVLREVSIEQDATLGTMEHGNMSDSGEEHVSTLQAFWNVNCTGNGGDVKNLVPGKSQRVKVYAHIFDTPRWSFYLNGPARVQACKGRQRTKHFKHCVDMGLLKEGCHAIDPWTLQVNWCLVKTLIVEGVDEGTASSAAGHAVVRPDRMRDERIAHYPVPGCEP